METEEKEKCNEEQPIMVTAEEKRDAERFRKSLSSEKIFGFSRLGLIGEHHALEEQKLDFAKLRNKVVVLTCARIVDLNRDLISEIHVKELNRLIERFGADRIAAFVFWCDDKSWIWEDRSSENKKMVKNCGLQISRKLGLKFSLTYPTHIDGGYSSKLIQYLKDRSGNNVDIGKSFGAYFLFDGTGIFVGRFDNIFPGQLESEIELVI